MMFSTMTIVPSTTMPKSSAPKDNRFAGMLRRSRQIDANNKEKGIVAGDDQCSPDITQKEQKNDRDQDEAFREVFQDSVGRVVYQIAPIVERNDFHARRQKFFVQLLHLLVNTPYRIIKVGSLAHEHDAGDDIIVVDDLPVRAMDRPPELTQADLGTLRNNGNVPDAHRRSILRLDDRYLRYRARSGPVRRTLH